MNLLGAIGVGLALGLSAGDDRPTLAASARCRGASSR